MTVNDILGDENAVGVTLPQPLPVLSTVSRDEFLHETSLLVLCGGDTEIPRDTLTKIETHHAAAITSHGEGDRASLASTIRLLNGRIHDRLLLRKEIAADRQEHQRLGHRIGALTDEIEIITHQLRIKRRDEIDRRIANELTQLELDRQKAIDDLQAVILKEYERRKAIWDGTADDRQRRATVLADAQQRGRASTQAAADRAAKLNDRMITKTVAGFLAWLGYAAGRFST